MDEDADTYLLPKKFKVKFSNELFKYSSLTGCNNPDKLLAEWTAEHKKRASVLPRKSFLHWQIEQTEFTKQLSKIYKDSLNDDTAFARAWFYIVRLPVFAGHSQQTEPKIEKLAENSFVRVCVEEILTWFWSSEKLALVYYYNGKYPEDDKRRIEAIYASRGEIGKGKLKRPTTAVSLSNLARFRIRRYFEEKQGVLFNDSWLVKGTAVTTSQIRNKILNLMGGFHREIDETLIPYLPIAGKKKRSTEITLSQECTKSAHNSIRAYLDLLTTSKAGIKVECKTQERKLVLPLDKIKDDLKAPIVELARNERIRFSADEISNYIDECARIVDKTLSSDEFQKNPIVVQFSALIYNEPIASNATENYLVDRLLASRQSIMKLTKAPNTIESGIFVIDMAKVWEVLQERGHTIVQKCSRQIRECFHDSVSELQKEFVRFKKILNFRSMDPTTMLKNKTEVNELSAQDIPKAVANLCDAYDRMHKLTQLVQFDPREHEYLINVANLRRALPRHVADHNLFFQRRLHIFAHYVRKRQTTLEVSAQNALNQMKVLNNFTNPDEVENYLAEMRVLKPLILTLHQELVELNEQEKVVNLPPLSLNEIQVVGSQVNNLWSLFDWTKRFYDFKANFYKRRRTEVRVQECQMFLDTFIETLMDLSVKLESQRATKVFLSQLKTEIEKFRHNIPVLEVMSCARLGARHWEKMSEIVGFNLALYENATVAQIAELNLNLYIAKLKPIAFVADREGQISDQANFITDYWTETSFTMDITHFWGIHVPSNLETLIKSASEHVSKIKAYREPDNEKSFINQSLDTWIKNLNNLLNLLKKWNVLLKCWKRISNVMRHSYLKVPDDTKEQKLKQGGGAKQQHKKQKLDRVSSESSMNDESLNSSGGSKKHLSWSKNLVSYQTKESENLDKAKASVLHATQLLTSIPSKSALAPKHRKSSEDYEMMSTSVNNTVLAAEKSSPMDLSEAGSLPVKLPKNVSNSKFAQKKPTPGADGNKSKKGKKKSLLSDEQTEDEIDLNEIIESMFTTSESEQSNFVDEKPASDEMVTEKISKKKGKSTEATLVKSDEPSTQKVENVVIEQPKELNVKALDLPIDIDEMLSTFACKECGLILKNDATNIYCHTKSCHVVRVRSLLKQGFDDKKQDKTRQKKDAKFWCHRCGSGFCWKSSRNEHVERIKGGGCIFHRAYELLMVREISASENNNIAFEQVLKVADNLGGTSATMTREKLVIDILSTRIEREIERNLANGRAASKKLVLYTVDGKRPIEIIKDIKAENINIGLDTYLRNLRFASPRMCLISNSDIMKLLSMETAEDGQVFLQIIQRECFPLLRELYLNDDGHLFGVNIDGERVKFENFVPIATLRDEEPQVFVDNIEKTIADFIIQDYVKYTEHRSTIKMSFRLTRVINDFILHQTQDSGFKHVFEEDVLKIHLRGNQLEIPVTPDFIHSAIPAVNVDVHFAHNWALGKIPLFFANITETRSRIQQMCRNLLCSVRFLNCHPGIQSSVFDTIIEACEKGTVLFVLENVDQLPESLYNHLCLCLGRLENECARLILCTTLHATAQQLARHLKVFHSRSILRPESAGDATKPIGAAGLNVSAVTGQKRRISTAKQPPAVNVVKQQVVSSVVAQANRKSDEEELMSTLFGDSINLTNVNFSVCCVGPTAKLLLTDCIERGNAKASWIYIDALTYSQVISAAKEFGEASSGYLIKCLKEAMQVEDQSPRAYSPPAPQTDRKESLPTTAGTTTTDDSMRRLSVAYKTPKYIIFYGFQQFIQHFPQICSLFYSMSSNVVPEMPPGAYISMSDGSNFYAAKNIRFVLCLPSSNETITSWLNRYEIKTINVSEAIKQPARYFWDKFKVKLEYIVRRGEYLEVVESTMEHLVFPVLDDLKFSDFMEIENMFICLEKDIEDAMAFVTIANYGEVLRAATTQCCVNFMITYTTNEIGLLDSKVEEHANSWDRSTSELGKLPFPVSQHKLASLEHIVWEKWIDDAKVKASMKKEYSLSELFVSTTKIERIVNYVVRQFNASDKHFILCGQNYIGKSAIVRRIIKQLEQLLTDYKFIWMDCTGRFDLIEMQNKLSAISLTSKKACLIIDHFCFCESSKALLELYTDHTMLVTHNEPQLCVTDLRLMLVMENEELDKCWAYGEFRKNFHVIPIRPLSEPELNYILERLICWHLNTKTFSSEYLSMVPLLAGASQQIFKIFGKPIDQLIPYIIRLAKGLMFAFPDNTPDLDCMKRLWIHEIIRILYDRELNNEIVQQFLEKLDPILEEFLKTTVEKLFPSREKGDNEDDDFYDKKDAPSWALPDFKLEKLLYSEMAGAESSMDGINYGLVRRSDFNKALANLHFEYTNNHSGFEVNLVITDFSSDHCQRLMRVLRQHNENMVLAGHPGCGRHQCVKLATFGVVGLVYHAFFDTQTAEAFETSWRNVIIRVINVLASANQPVSVVFHLDYCIDKIPIEWLTMLKQWLQRPVIGDLLSDTVIIKMAEKMIESEKTLATLVQSSNIRLPGQRYCQFLSFEAYKNVDLLRNTLEARLADFLHAVFLIPPSHLHLFEWCTADYYKSITNGECKTMLDKIAIDCVASNKHRIRDAIDQLFSATKDLIARSEFNCLQFYADSKLLYDLAQSTVVLFNKKHGQLEQRTTLLTTALDTMVQIKELSIIGAHSSLFELTRKLEDAELVMMFLKRTQQEAATELTTLKEKIERLQRDCAVISDKLLQRNAKIGIVLEAPIKDFREASEKLTVYTAADYAKLAKMKTPSLGLKYTIEAVRRAVERGFKPSRNHLDAWLNSIKTLSNKDFCEKVAKFDPNSISATKLKALTEILKNQDIKEQRLIVESPLAADLCKWVKAAQSFANSNKQLKNHRSAASDLSKQLSSKQDQLNTLKDKQQFLARRLISVEREIEQQDRAVHKLNRLIFYRQRGDIVLQALSPLQNRWKTMIGNSKIRLDNLLGNSIIQSAFRVLFGCVNADAKTAIMSKIRSSLIRYNIQYEEKFTAVPTLAIEYFRWISWKEPWPLIQTKRPDLANTLKFFYNDCALLDMSQMAEGWTDREVVDKLLRSSYSDTALIITNVQSSPPAAFYEILLREPDKEKRTVEFMERSILMGENLKLIFLTTHGLSSFEPEFIRIVTPIKLEEQFDMKDSQLGGESLFPTEEDLLKQLTNYSAIDILETEDVTNQIIQLAESIPLS